MPPSANPRERGRVRGSQNISGGDYWSHDSKDSLWHELRTGTKQLVRAGDVAKCAALGSTPSTSDTKSKQLGVVVHIPTLIRQGRGISVNLTQRSGLHIKFQVSGGYRVRHCL